MFARHFRKTKTCKFNPMCSLPLSRPSQNGQRKTHIPPRCMHMCTQINLKPHFCTWGTFPAETATDPNNLHETHVCTSSLSLTPSVPDISNMCRHNISSEDPTHLPFSCHCC